MSEHLPECPWEPIRQIERGLVMEFYCICERLRACEKRVRDEERGYQRALDAAREAIAAMDIGRDVRFSVDVQADALAAIDALREERSDD